MSHERTMTNIERVAVFSAQMATKTSGKDRVELFQNAVIETGGDWHYPETEGQPGRGAFEVQLLGIVAHGIDAAEAVNCWAAKAKLAVDRAAHVGAAELIVLHELKDCSDEVLREAAETVRLHSQDQRAIAAGRRVEMMFRTKEAAA
ncbi:hypothetical protein QKW60_05715 [Defluviimonas aestuarii]|uniref:hypothetical protein n=1 Tax=Albidovulum aestuarii TaxID=1130726 RepID=UPI00249CAC24|nr:hypothetical protein [Defluviimonas aestuarii]MDI3335894.1 hypothetical protein [Defluviimonas aestuarii]